jgi:hypothetical protein
MIRAAARLAACLAGLVVAIPCGAAADVTATQGGIAAGRDITGPVTIGLSPEQVKELTSVKEQDSRHPGALSQPACGGNVAGAAATGVTAVVVLN